MQKKAKPKVKSVDSGFEKFKGFLHKKFSLYFTWSKAYQWDEKKLSELLAEYGSNPEFPAPQELLDAIEFDDEEEDIRYRSGLEPDYRAYLLNALEDAFQDAMHGWRHLFKVQVVPKLQEEAGPEQMPAAFVVHDQDGYTSFTCNGKEYLVTVRQGKAIKMLHKAYKAGSPDVPHERILLKLDGTADGQLRDTFRRTRAEKLWTTLIISKKKGFYRLNIQPHPVKPQ